MWIILSRGTITRSATFAGCVVSIMLGRVLVRAGGLDTGSLKKVNVSFSGRKRILHI